MTRARTTYDADAPLVTGRNVGKTCRGCGAPVPATRYPTAEFCTMACQQRDNDRRQHARRMADPARRQQHRARAREWKRRRRELAA